MWKSKCLRYNGITAFIFMNVLIVLLFIAELIPTNYLNRSMDKNIAQLIESRLGSDKYTSEDKNADAVIFNMVLNRTSNKLQNVFKPIHRGPDTQQYLKQLKDFEDGDKTKHEYVQYWHGYRILWYPLLLILNYNGLRVLMGILISVLLSIIVIDLVKFDITFSLLFLIYSTPFLVSGAVTLEYVPVILITLITSIIALKKETLMPTSYFLYVGILTAFLDFLTAETLTFTIPYLMLLIKYKTSLKHFICSGVHWIFGYVGCFSYKYILLSLLYHQNYFSEIFNIYSKHFRTIGKGAKCGAIQMNLGYLLRGNVAIEHFTFIVITICLLYTILIVCSHTTMTKKVQLSVLILIPYLRYITLSEHSLFLSYFTYRAQLIVPLVFYLLISNSSFLTIRRFERRRNYAKDI